MSGPRRRFLAVLAAAALAAACQPLPHPFAEDRPPASLLTMRDSAGVSVAPVEGEPSATATKLSAAVASALLQREIPASDRTTSLGSYLFHGRIERVRARDGKTTLTAHWRLQNAAGEPVGERTAKLDAAAREWLADKGYDPAYGARPLRRVIQKTVQDPLAEMILSGRVKDGEKVTISATKFGLTFNGKVAAAAA